MCFNLRDLKKVIFFQVNVALTLIKDDTFITSTWKRLAVGGVKFARCLRVLWFLNNRSVFEMKGRWGGHKIALPEKCPNTECPISRIQAEYGEIRSISPCSVRMRENMDQKKLRIWTLFTHCLSFFFLLLLFFCRSHKCMTPKEI